ncbi:hypothetical protein M9435_005176 [Picochlorum sp. BPE23]|nr:hypothetical protein M9435_005176 [Picochlorum sp. BPE23]
MMYAKQLFTAILGAGLVFSATVNAQTCSTPYQAISDEPTLSVVKQAIDAAGLKEFLDDPSLDATIFLPNNAGMTTFLETVNASAEDLLGSDRLENFLKNHVHIVAHNVSDLYEGEVIDMANGDEISINFKKEDDPKYAGCDGNHLHIGSHTNIDSDPIECDIQACQSVIHILDYPLIPDDPALQEEFPKLVLSDIANDDATDHDHDDHEGEDHDHDHDDEASVSGESVSSSGSGLFGFMSVTTLILASCMISLH